MSVFGPVKNLRITSYNVCYTKLLRSVNIVQTSEILCYGDETAALNGNITGGTLSYSYLWNVNGDFTSFPQLNNLAAGYYDVTVTDANNCTAENHIIISQPDELTGVVVNVVNCSSPAARITSYNVCYTKLLRLSFV